MRIPSATAGENDASHTNTMKVSRAAPWALALNAANVRDQFWPVVGDFQRFQFRFAHFAHTACPRFIFTPIDTAPQLHGPTGARAP